MEGTAHLRHVRAAGERIAELADGRLEDPVPSMPGYDIGSLLLHTGGFCRWVPETVLQGKEPDVDWSAVGGDPVAFHRTELSRLVETLASRDPDEPTWAWGDDQHVRFFHRRDAQELPVHRWDVEKAVREPSDLLLFLWGRVTQRPLEVYGDATLLDRWQERVRI